MDCALPPGTRAWAEGKQAGENQAMGREGSRGQVMRALAAQRILAPHSTSCPMTDSGGPSQAELGGELPRRSEIISHLAG